MQLKKINNVFLLTFIFSSAIHVPLYTWVGNFYFGDSVQRFIKRLPSSHPFFTYIPIERKVTVTPAPSSGKEKKKVVKSSRTEKTAARAKKKTHDFELSLPTEKDLFTGKVLPVLKPTVENVDLHDTVVRRAFLHYYELLSALIGRFAVYPANARDAHVEGVVYVSFILRRDGNLGEVVMINSSGDGQLDGAAMAAIQNAAPFPPLPIEIRGHEIRLNVPISFELE